MSSPSLRVRPGVALVLLTSLAWGHPIFAAELLRVGLVEGSPPSLTVPWQSDVPASASVLLLLRRPACRLMPDAAPIDWGAKPPVSLEPRLWQIEVGDADIARRAAALYERLRTSNSPYRALLAPVQRVRAKDATLLLTTAYPWPDFATAACHPALAVFPGAYEKSGKRWVFNPARLPGNALPKGLTLERIDPRTAERKRALGELEVVLGEAPNAEAPDATRMRFATYLAFRPARTGPHFRAAVASLDREALARGFARQPAQTFATLLPAPFQVAPLQPPMPSPEPLAAQRTVELLYDVDVQDQARVAERLQLALHPLGYRLVLVPLTRAALESQWAGRKAGLALISLLLPQDASNAFAVVLEAAGRHDLLPLELPPLGALAPSERAARVDTRSHTLLPTLSWFPLFVQGAAVNVTPAASGLQSEAHGVPLLESLFFEPQPQPNEAP
ncbi:MAG: hypothetical protein ACKVPX_03385 [Myxococcaceae bacterium]